MSIDYTRLTADELDELVAQQQSSKPVMRFMGVKDVAAYIGLKSANSLAAVPLPPHDVEIAGRKGWLPETIDEWCESRPGRGRWGKRKSA